jgi:hypothetical protein
MIKILCAAVYCKTSGKHLAQPINIETGFVVCGYRHDACYMTLTHLHNFNFQNTIAGFLTSDNRFVTRVEAADIAFNANQLLPHIKEKPIELISENIY